MPLRPTIVHLSEELVARLDRKAAHNRVSRSRLIRDVLAAYLTSEVDESIADAYQAGYGQTPFGTPDAWGDLEAFHEALARERRRTSHVV